MTARVLVLYTGGTIGMVPSEQGYVPCPGFDGRLREELGERAAELPEYDLVEFDQLIDSANLTPSHWTHIVRMLEKRWHEYDGFVVLHGTDTMAYTASALSFLLRGCDRPVIITGSQIPLSQLRNDGVDNLVTALLLAADRRITEVCVCFNGRLLRGNRVRKVRTSGFDAFDSPNAPWLGQVGIDIELQEDLLLPPGTPDFLQPDFDPAAVVMLPVFPGMPARLLEAAWNAPGVRGLVLQSYGVGNPPDADEAWMASLERACNQGVTVINISQCQQGAVCQGVYATGAALNRLGVVAGADLTPEAAFAKLHVLLTQHREPQAVRQALAQVLCGEQS
ncbi:MAG: type I asparaginase [Pseudomonadales bacterium]|nr:type I asparaginase [Pseudomonadales bacterium]